MLCILNINKNLKCICYKYHFVYFIFFYFHALKELYIKKKNYGINPMNSC